MTPYPVTAQDVFNMGLGQLSWGGQGDGGLLYVCLVQWEYLSHNSSVLEQLPSHFMYAYNAHEPPPPFPIAVQLVYMNTPSP